MAVKSLRICDVCETEYAEENPGWMIMSVPNAPEEMGEVTYDFCSFDCLYAWVTSPDEGEEDPTLSQAQQAARASGGQLEVNIEELNKDVQHPELQNPSTVMHQERPPMTLMEAVAMGLKPGPHGG